RVAKQNANTAIDALTQLNTPQKAKLKEQVGQANRLEDVQSVQTNGQALNNAMKGLRDSIANETTVKTSQNYTDEVRITNQHIIALCQMRKVSLIKLTIRLWILVRLPKLQHK
ncbi:GA module-containing protein, partial [Acinetobacter baumannii]|nr:GA module-containing protein [Acinetobacter baumannii]